MATWTFLVHSIPIVCRHLICQVVKEKLALGPLAAAAVIMMWMVTRGGGRSTCATLSSGHISPAEIRGGGPNGNPELINTLPLSCGGPRQWTCRCNIMVWEDSMLIKKGNNSTTSSCVCWCGRWFYYPRGGRGLLLLAASWCCRVENIIKRENRPGTTSLNGSLYWRFPISDHKDNVIEDLALFVGRCVGEWSPELEFNGHVLWYYKKWN